MTGERLAHVSLRLDAIYCIVVGLLVVVLAPVVASAADLPAIPLAVVGVVTAVWGAYVWWLGFHRPSPTRTRLVMIANIAASSLLALAGIVAGTTALALGAAVLSIDVAAFAVSQGIALRRMRPHPA